MAENLDDGEFLLPPQFLADDEVATEKSTVSKSKNDGSLLPSGIPYGSSSYGFSSSLSSPVESLGSSETDCNEKEHQNITELTRKMAHSTPQPDSNLEAWNRNRQQKPFSTHFLPEFGKNFFPWVPHLIFHCISLLFYVLSTTKQS